MNELVGSCNQVETACRIEEVTISGRLQQRKVRLEGELARINAALEALNKNPGLQECMDLVSSALR